MVLSSSESTSALLGLSNNLADAVERAGLSVVAVNGRQQLASSGIHWRPGVIVTADHTIDREEGISVTLPSGQTVPATLAGRDAGTDIAVLRVEGADVPVPEIADSATLRIGHIVVAVARPGETGLSASLGTISALGGAWRTWAGGQVDQLIRPDLTLYPGFSGGPLVDAAGRVAGLNTSGLSRRLTLAIPTGTVNRVVEQLLTRGRIARGYLGVGLQSVRLPDSLKSSLGLEQQDGLIVVSVESGGPAETAGMLVGDILIALDGKPVSDTHDVQSLLDPERVGKSIGATVARGGTRTALTLTVGERPHTGAR